MAMDYYSWMSRQMALKNRARWPQRIAPREPEPVEPLRAKWKARMRRFWFDKR